MAQEIDPDARFKRAREQAKGETTAATQQRKEALRRKFAQAGLTSSGAAIKQEQLAEKQGQQALGQRLGAIDTAQEESALRRQEIEKQREFQRSEREAGQAFGAEQALKQRGFAAQQAELQRKFQSGERLSSQEFAALQAGKQREFQSGERLSSQDFAAQQANIAREIQKTQFGQQMQLALDKFALDKEVTEFNKKMAIDEANKKDWFDRLGDQGTAGWKGLFESGGPKMSDIGIGSGGGRSTGIQGRLLEMGTGGLFGG